MPSREYMFGGEHFIVTVEGNAPAIAQIIIVVNGGHNAQSIGDALGNPLELPATGQGTP